MTRLFQLDLHEIQQGRVFPDFDDFTGIHHVLDLACGPGEWVMAVAQAYPYMEVEGIDKDVSDIEAARRQALMAGLSNARFRALDPLDASSIPDGTFDLVNARFMAGFTTLDTWPKLVREGLRLLRPGGVIRLVEADTPITTGPATERLSALVSRALWLAKCNLYPPTTSGQNLLITPKLGRVLHDAGYLDIRQTAFVTNFSAGMTAHAAISQNLATVYQNTTTLLIERGVATQEEVESLQAQMRSELHTFNAIGFYLTVSGKKP